MLRLYRIVSYIIAIGIFLLIVSGLLQTVDRYLPESRCREIRKDEDREESGESSEETGDIPDIRVLLLSDGYRNEAHPEVVLSAEHGLVMETNGQEDTVAKSGTVEIDPDDERFADGPLRIRAQDGGDIQILSLNRGCGHPCYAGVLELHTTAEGIVIINELPVEAYLCRVVPSEMPASYELEALKAQAVCARSYAYRQMADYAYPEYRAHVNDSTDYQVYGNSAAQETSTRAVEETRGEVVLYQGKVAVTYYYSTSCGRTAGLEAWGSSSEKEFGYLQSVEVKDEDGDYERNLPWYRWEARIPAGTLSDLVGLNTGKDLGKLKNAEVTETGAGGIALKLCLTGEKGTEIIETENRIRRALGGDGYQIRKQDGSEVASSELLPSAFFTIKKSGEQFVISGGGYGHGIGMSQNGANEMAKKGKTYVEILQMFYTGIQLGTGNF